jgi:hypothetical protein
MQLALQEEKEWPPNPLLTQKNMNGSGLRRSARQHRGYAAAIRADVER